MEGSSDRARVMKEELNKGHEVASELRRVILEKRPSLDVSGRSAEGLVNKVLGSFANALSMLNIGIGKESHKELISDDQPIHVTSISGAGSGDSSASKHRRSGFYKRRKTSQFWTIDSPALTDDGHAWRKYGKKVIHNAKHPRNYYRCTYKFDQACPVTKHVQKIEDDPPLFRTTYYGNHTCRDCTTPRDKSSNIISFDDTNNIMTNQQCTDDLFFSSFTSFEKELIMEENIPTSYHVITHHNHVNQSPSFDYLVAPDMTTFESFEPMNMFSSTVPELDHEDVISRLMVESYDFDDEVLQCAVKYV